MSKPLVSVLIPAYNAADYLDRAIKSALVQADSPIEVIVINDGSTDEGATKAVCQPYIDSKSILYYEKPNGGVSSALNEGLAHCQGDYFVWLSADDELEPQAIQQLVDALKPDVKMFPFGRIRFIDEQGKRSPLDRLSSKRKKGIQQPKDYFPMDLSLCTALLPVAYAKEHPFDPSYVYMPDAEFLYRLCIDGHQAIYCKGAIYDSRIHKGQITHQKMDLFEEETKRMHGRYMEYAKETKDIGFLKNYYRFMMGKVIRYGVYKPLIVECLNEISKNQNVFLLRIEGFFLKAASAIPFALRKALGR